MSDEHTSVIKTPKQFIIAILAAFLVPIISIVLLSQLAIISLGGISKNDPAMSPEAVAKRLKPVGEVVMADTSMAKGERSGEDVVKMVCSVCHATGVLNAPKIGDKKAWAARFKIGEAALVNNAINGIRQMPARGGNSGLSDHEVTEAVEYMAKQSGVKVKEVAAQPAAGTTLKTGTGKTVFEANCAVCHVPGAANAPKFGDKDAWKPRIKTGVDNLYKSAINGKNAMPPKGGNATLADADVKAAVDYIVSQSK